MSNEDIGHVLNIIAAPLAVAFLAALMAAVFAVRRRDIGRALIMYPLACAFAAVTILAKSIANLLGA